LGHLRLEIIIAVVAMHAARLLCVGMDVDRGHVVEIGQLRFRHFRFPAARSSQGSKLIIPYNKFGKAPASIGDSCCGSKVIKNDQTAGMPWPNPQPSRPTSG